MKARKHYLNHNLTTFYAPQAPLKIVRGEKQFLYEEDGTKYLDCVNNVCHVGHCHPVVVNAAVEQLKKLNTNTRYLNDNIVRFAKALSDTLPEGLCVCTFTNSGSEANELALRMARTFTKRKDIICIHSAYHGNT